MPASSDHDEATTVELRFYATFREAVGQKAITRTVPKDATLADALVDAAEEYPDLGDELLTDEHDLRDGVRALRNGSERAESDTRLADGDELSFVTPIHGG